MARQPTARGMLFGFTQEDLEMTRRAKIPIFKRNGLWKLRFRTVRIGPNGTPKEYRPGESNRRRKDNGDGSQGPCLESLSQARAIGPDRGPYATRVLPAAVSSREGCDAQDRFAQGLRDSLAELGGPLLGGKQLHKISRTDVQSLIATVLEAGRSPQTARHVQKLVQAIFTHAEDVGLYSGATRLPA